MHNIHEEVVMQLSGQVKFCHSCVRVIDTRHMVFQVKYVFVSVESKGRNRVDKLQPAKNKKIT